MSEGKFTVWLFFPDGSHHSVKRLVGAKEAVDTAFDYSQRPAAAIGVIRRIIITDEDDFCTFEWKNGEGVTYPPREIVAAGGGPDAA